MDHPVFPSRKKQLSENNIKIHQMAFSGKAIAFSLLHQHAQYQSNLGHQMSAELQIGEKTNINLFECKSL